MGCDVWQAGRGGGCRGVEIGIGVDFNQDNAFGITKDESLARMGVRVLDLYLLTAP